MTLLKGRLSCARARGERNAANALTRKLARSIGLPAGERRGVVTGKAGEVQAYCRNTRSDGCRWCIS